MTFRQELTFCVRMVDYEEKRHQQPMSLVEEKNGKVLLHVRVQPRASRNSLIREADGRVRVTLMAPPVGDAANKALVEYVAKRLGIRRGAVELAAGDRSREKTLAISGLPFSEVVSKLERL